MPTERIQLASEIEGRYPVSSRDAVSANCLFETRGQVKEIVKRPGYLPMTYTSGTIPVGEGQGLYGWNSTLLVGQTNALYSVNNGVVSAFTGASIVGTSMPFSFTTMDSDQQLVFHNGSQIYTVAIGTTTIAAPMAGGAVTSLNVANGGGGYTSAPTVTISAPGGAGVTATASATVYNGVVTGLTLLTAGSGYTTTPTVTIAAPTGVTQAVVDAAATWANITYTGLGAKFNLSSVTLSNSGAGYTTNPNYTLNTYYRAPNGSVTWIGSWPLYGSVVNATIQTTVITNNTSDITPSIVTLPATAVLVKYLGGVEGYFLDCVIPSPAGATTQATGNASLTSNITGPFVYGLEYLDGYCFIMNEYGTIYQSEPMSTGGPAAPWNAINKIAANSEPDNGVALTKHLNYLVGFGNWHTDFFYDNGNPTGSVLLKQQSAKIEIGCAVGTSVAKAANTVFWMGQSITQGRGIYCLDGMRPTKISTRYIDKILNNDNLRNCHSYCMNTAGHTLYVLTLYTSDRTLVYDVDEKEWYEWSSSALGVEGYFLLTYFTGNTEYSPGLYLQHEGNGQVYKMSPDFYSDDGNPILFKSTTAIKDFGSTKRKFYRRVEVVGDKIIGTLTISHSDDDYQTWSTGRTVDMSLARPVLYQNGSSRRRAWRITSSSNVPIRLQALEVDVEQAE